MKVKIRDLPQADKESKEVSGVISVSYSIDLSSKSKEGKRRWAGKWKVSTAPADAMSDDKL